MKVFNLIDESNGPNL